MGGETDLEKMLATLRVVQREESFTVVSVPEPVELGAGIAALITEAEGITAVVTVAEAQRRGWPVDFVAAWLTLEVHSSLDAVGLTAAFSTALGTHGIACNVLAGYFHDHILVPIERADEAIQVLEALGG